jgi:hypothetical protein
MSLNKLTNPLIGKSIKLNIGCSSMVCEDMVCNKIMMPAGADIDSHDLLVNNDLTVLGDAVLAGNNYSTSDLGQPNYSLHTDGEGNTFWSPDDTGSGDITFNGSNPTIAGQLLKLSSIDGSTAQQSLIIDDGVNLNINNQNITNVNLVDGVNLTTLNNQVSTNSGNITTLQNTTTKYNDIAPTIAGQLVVFNSVDGLLVKQDGAILTPTELQLGIKNIQCASGNFSGSILTDEIKSNVNSNIKIENCIIEDEKVNCDLILERTLNNGVNIEGVLHKDGLVEGINLTTLNNQVSTNSGSIGTLSSNKLDKIGTDNLQITNSTPEINLIDTVSIGGSNGVLKFTDSTIATIAMISAPSGKLTLDGNGIDMLDSVDMKTNAITNSSHLITNDYIQTYGFANIATQIQADVIVERPFGPLNGVSIEGIISKNNQISNANGAQFNSVGALAANSGLKVMNFNGVMAVNDTFNNPKKIILENDPSLNIRSEVFQVLSTGNDAFNIKAASTSILLITNASGQEQMRIINNAAIILPYNLSATGHSFLEGGLTVGADPNQYDMPTVRGTNGQYLQTNGIGGSSWASIPQKSYGYFGFTTVSQTTTPISVIGTFEQIVGIKTAPRVNGFTFDGFKLTYTGLVGGYFSINSNISWKITSGVARVAEMSVNDAARITEMAVFKNDVVVPSSTIQGALDATSAYPRESATSCIEFLSTNDYVELKVANIVSTNDIDIIAYNFTITEI